MDEFWPIGQFVTPFVNHIGLFIIRVGLIRLRCRPTVRVSTLCAVLIVGWRTCEINRNVGLLSAFCALHISRINYEILEHSGLSLTIYSVLALAVRDNFLALKWTSFNDALARRNTIIFTARCTLVQSAVLRSYIVRLSVRLWRSGTVITQVGILRK